MRDEKRGYALLLLALLGISLATGAQQSRSAPADKPFFLERIRIRVGVPRVVRGPSSGIPDSPFTEISLPNGRFRGFSASTNSYAIDGASPADMSGEAHQVMSPRPHGQWGESGEWIVHVEQSGKTVLAWVHDETGDSWTHGAEGVKSMSLAVSEDDGLHWHNLGQIITGTEPLTPGRIAGEGDCTAVNGRDGYYYAYCLRNRDYSIIVARAPVDHPEPGNWKKYFHGTWSQPGVAGDADKLPEGVGTASAYWQPLGLEINLGSIGGGVGLSFSEDHVNFTALNEPLIPDLKGNWRRPGDPNELLTYWSLLDRNTGLNQLSNQWMLSYTDIQPNEGFDKRYQVFRPVDVSLNRSPQEPAVGIMLAHWYNVANHVHISTIAAVPDNDNQFKIVEQSGYMMTAPDATRKTVALEECISSWPGHPDYIVIASGVCEKNGYRRLRTAGWVYTQPQVDTVPLYRCYSSADKTHFTSNQKDCAGLGRSEQLLGYALK